LGYKIHRHGYWIGEDILCQHFTDFQLATALAHFFKTVGASSVVDLGCGTADYVKILRSHQIFCEGYDGNPDTFKLSGGVARVADLSQPLDLGKKFDWVMSLEVGEHLPKEFEKTFIENLSRHALHGIVLSWAIQGQGGFGHFNEQDNDYIKSVILPYGYTNDIYAENMLRNYSRLPWFKNTIMVFSKKASLTHK
jgi:hypothetical protein